MKPLATGIRRLTLCAAVLLVGSTAISFLGSLHWLAELLTHFRVQYVVLAAGLLVLALLARSGAGAGLAAGVLLVNGACVAPDLIAVPPATSPGEPVLKLLVANVMNPNPRVRPLRRLIRDEDPDLVGLLEVDERWLRELDELRERYPHRLEDPRRDHFGLALYSRIPFTARELAPLADSGVNAALVGLRPGKREVGLLLVHSLPPTSARGAAIRNAQLEHVVRLRERYASSEFMVVGDFNTTPWSPAFGALTRRAGLRSAARGHGWAPTWPAGFLPLMIPIDHGLLSPGLHASTYRRGPEIGSDHRPIVLEVGFAESGAG